MERDERGIREVFLQPGGFHFGGGRTRVRTLLGSCIAIVLWHPGLRIGGMCHFVLPHRAHARAAHKPDGRYGDDAMRMFLAEISRHDAAADAFTVKLFGGARMFLGRAEAGVPERNVAHARELLAANGFATAVEDVGGARPRALALDLWSGEVWLRRGGA